MTNFSTEGTDNEKIPELKVISSDLNERYILHETFYSGA
jgi:hypothetical protein